MSEEQKTEVGSNTEEQTPETPLETNDEEATDGDAPADSDAETATPSKIQTPEGAEEEDDLKYVCGMILNFLPGGDGVEFLAIPEGNGYAREPTVADMDMMVAHMNHHFQGVLAASQVKHIINKQMHQAAMLRRNAKGIKKRIIT